MKIAVLSDSHYEASSIRAIKKYLEDVDIILHCGDGAPDTKILMDGFNGEIYAVKGNCDFSMEYPIERIIEVMGLKIFMTHGHMYNVKNEYNTIFYKGKEVGANIVVFGHSHKALIDQHDGLIIMNPGSITLPYGRAKKTLGFIEILENNKTDIYLKEVE
ncbi:YfcE family phosphodiesterase [Clostridium perfringens]|uniref:metallophosphoesterase n=1 Tax=Clostridium perfringens TaxID=1502 RepID=UPI002AC3EAE2|nr:metallophosphoesterase [Clostridium perfringens]MDZ4956932.1 YfcE family phosphodiesterase [Clostridium perfringens]